MRLGESMAASIASQWQWLGQANRLLSIVTDRFHSTWIGINDIKTCFPIDRCSTRTRRCHPSTWWWCAAIWWCWSYWTRPGISNCRGSGRSRSTGHSIPGPPPAMPPPAMTLPAMKLPLPAPRAGPRGTSRAPAALWHTTTSSFSGRAWAFSGNAGTRRVCPSSISAGPAPAFCLAPTSADWRKYQSTSII